MSPGRPGRGRLAVHLIKEGVSNPFGDDDVQVSTAAAAGCLILSGTPGAGKTTVARLLAGDLPRSAHVGGDEVSLMVASGAVGPVSEPRAEAERQLLLRAHNICSLANNFAAFGFYPVLDHVVPNRRILDLMVELLRPRPVLFVTLAPTLEVAAARNAARPRREQVQGTFAALRQEMSDELASVGWWFDTSALTPEQTATTITTEAPTRAVLWR